ncbi:MAG: ABC transporter permease [Clostridiaceae bacterium]|nr:ABC transporter permease [Bacillota bacterium]NLN51255.1 ABC transporter permease [Clostridiaceae bacterium]
MRVFKMFLKLVNKYKGLAIMYIGIMLIIYSMTISQFAKQKDQFELYEAGLAVIDHEQSDFSNHFKQFLLQDNYEVIVEDDRDLIADKFYEGSLDYLVVIPEDFSETFAKDPNSIDLKTQASLNNQISSIFTNKINSYINIWNQYRIFYNHQIPQDKIPGIIKEIDQIMAPSVKIAAQSEMKSENYKVFAFAITQINYIVIVLGFSIIGLSFLIMEDPLIKKRELVSGYPEGKRTRELFAAAFVVIIAIWLLLIGICFAYTSIENLKLKAVQTLILSSFIHLIAVTALVLFVSHLYPQKNSSNFLGNMLGLVTSFATGIFITRDFLNPTLLKASSITPTYWNVSNSYHVQENMLSKIDYNYMLRNMSVMIVMAITFILLTFVLRRMKLKEGA